MQFKKTRSFISFATFLAWSSAQAQVIWQADSTTCIQKASGAYAGCQEINKTIDLFETVTPTVNEFIKAQSYVTSFKYVYPCAGREDTTYLQFGDNKLQVGFNSVESTSTFVHDFNTSEKVKFVRESRGFSTISNVCKFEITSADTAISSTDSLKEYVKKSVGALRKLKTAFDKLKDAADFTVVQNALFDVQTQLASELSALNSKKGDLELDLEFANEGEKAEIQAKIDALLPKILDVTAGKNKVDAALAKLAVTCSQAEGGTGNQTCKNFLTETVNELAGLNEYFADELKEEILPWLNGEIARLEGKQEAIRTSLTSLKTIIENN